ncbi:MAG: hypothetical protein Q7S66_04340 [bacterium]|nr:hypothetical protein [bacterium]
MDIILKSLASAVVTAIILLIAKFAGPKLAGALGGGTNRFCYLLHFAYV